MRFLIALLMLASPALAQQPPPDPAFMQRALSALQAQRNAALDGQAAETARAAGLQEEITKLKAEVEELKNQAPTGPKK